MHRHYTDALQIINRNAEKDAARRAKIRRATEQETITVTLTASDARTVCYLLTNAISEQRLDREAIITDETDVFSSPQTVAYWLTAIEDEIEKYQAIINVFAAQGISIKP